MLLQFYGSNCCQNCEIYIATASDDFETRDNPVIKSAWRWSSNTLGGRRFCVPEAYQPSPSGPCASIQRRRSR